MINFAARAVHVCKINNINLSVHGGGIDKYKIEVIHNKIQLIHNLGSYSNYYPSNDYNLDFNPQLNTINPQIRIVLKLLPKQRL